MERKIKRKAVLYGVAAVLLVAVISMLSIDMNYQPKSELPLPSSIQASAFLPTFSSAEALKDFLKANSRTQGAFSLYGPYDVNTLTKSLGLPAAQFYSAQEGSAQTNQHSNTNIQVAGVDEADIVKTDGQYIYVVSGNVISILEAYPPLGANIVSRINLDDLQPMGIFVSSDRLVVLGSKYSVPTGFYQPYSMDIKTFVNLYDIQDRSAPVLLRNLIVTGSYFNSRMIGKYVYFVTGQPAYVIYDSVILPKFYTEGQAKEVAPSEIHYSNGTDEYYQYTTFVAVNMQDPTEAPTYLTVMMGGASETYVSLDNIYIAFPDVNDNTSIYRVRIKDNNMTCEANGKVPGQVPNQFSMDEYNGHFRIATSAWVNGVEQNSLYVLDMNLTMTGNLTNLGVHERLHSVRFMEDRCYLVTFQKTDPLFVINLSEPTNPTVLGQLKIPGYSDYLHPYDETHIIGVGKETVEAEEGYFAWYQGIKISLFDVSNVSDPKQMYNVTIGDRGSDSPVLTDHKAFLFDRAKNLLVIPVLYAKIDPAQYSGNVPKWAYGTAIWQGAYVFNITLTEGIVLRGNVTHQTGAFTWNSGLDVKRALYIEDALHTETVLYTVSDKKIEMNDLDDLALLKEIDLP